MTVTEALAELKTIDKRLEKKREFILNNLYRQERLRDPHETSGGSRELVRRERQAIADLEQRKLTIRRAIQMVNEVTSVSVAGKTQTVAEWLVWRREIEPGVRNFLHAINNKFVTMRKEAQVRGLRITEGDSQTLDDVIVNVSEASLAQEAEQLEEITGALDGQLSLKNATVLIEI